MNADGSAQTNLTNFLGPCTPGVVLRRFSGDDVEPSWSPDGSRLPLRLPRRKREIYLMGATGVA